MKPTPLEYLKYLSLRNKEVSERKHKDGFTCSHCHSNNAVCFGKYNVKKGSRTLERQRYRCKDCGKTFTDVTNTPSSSYSPSSQMDGVRSMYDRRQFPT